MPRARPPRWQVRGDDAVSEVVGYVLMLFMSSALLVLSLQAFIQSREDVQELQAARELRLVADRLAAELHQASLVATSMPNASYEALVRLPAMVGRPYYVNASHGIVYANTTDGLSANSTVFRVEGSGEMQLMGTVQGAQGVAKVEYERLPAGWRTIRLTI